MMLLLLTLVPSSDHRGELIVVDVVFDLVGEVALFGCPIGNSQDSSNSHEFEHFNIV